ncbi:hypothetical protein NAEGRDRAFT_53783 [Naegleria gruberi]|uniref:F-box domain-containing protein n=1 Tax=Naegleria gruberi TaxID=5762 RepID=D2W0Q8_NAEGR|nr:uncharacterized protein NAEGRDRAFT_53783 [Naegleria gruberi]EFC37335.1 hypothetical protein NAEGRDRAFT_53783 [Naegleria gruberi]|eukprot:XP_002670079.1 hypothetical protein NAEGRDRAFT_53783 [Naegleria gruberi strain NEG-M]
MTNIESHQDPFPQDDILLPFTNESNKENSPTPSLGQLEDFPFELLISIATHLNGKDIYSLSKVNSVFLKLLFNQTSSRIAKVLLPYKIEGRNQKLNSFSILRQRSTAFEYRKDELDQQLFNMVQERIWKPLVCYYFPRFNIGLDVKNWMHLLRRRIAHLQVNSPHYLPLTKHEPIKRPLKEGETKPPVKFNPYMDPFEWATKMEERNPYEIDGIENCEWVYKCPMDYDSMIEDDPEKRFCTNCGKHVYKVYSQDDVESHSKLGHCIVMMKLEMPPIPPVLGMPVFLPPTPPPPAQ